MNRREFLRCTLVGAGAALAVDLLEGAPNRRWRPNVLFFLVDDMGWMDSSVYGSKYYLSPQMARLAGDGMRFTNAYSPSPLCSPTRASIMTGLYPQRLRLTQPACHLPELGREPAVSARGPRWCRTTAVDSRRKLPLAEFTIAEALKAAGYKTEFFGKWHLGKEARYWPGHQGFDINIGGTGAPGPRSYFSPYKNPKLSDGPEGQYITDRLTDEAVKYLNKHDAGGKPFFMCMWHFAVHAPFQGRKDIIKRFAGKRDPRGMQDSPTMAAMLYSMDESLGRIMDTLKARGLADSTIIIFFSDNGGNMYNVIDDTTPTNNFPLRGGKGTVWEGGVRVPMIVKWPGRVARGVICDIPVSGEDFYPTILNMAGGIKPKRGKKLDGVDLVGLLTGKVRRLDREALFCHFPHENRVRANHGAASTVRKGHWKLHRYYCRGEGYTDRLELYNLKDDIGEGNNLAAKYPDKVAELKKLLDVHLKDTGALIPKKNPGHDPKTPKPITGLPPAKAKGKKLD